MSTVIPPVSTAARLDAGAGGMIGRAPAGRMLRAVVLKEVRQNLIFVALVFCLEAIVACFCLVWSKDSWLNILLNPDMRLAITQCCVLGGFVLGIVQPIADVNFERWSFLMHRPASRSFLFLGRAIAGMILYFIGTGIPLLVVIGIATTYTGGEYFLWRYTVPVLADFLTGIAWYFAGVLISDRYALFYGSRLAPAALAVVATVATAFLPGFWMVLLALLVIVAMLGISSVGSFMTRGYSMKPRAWIRAVLILTFLAAFSGILFVGMTGMRADLQVHRPELSQVPVPPYQSIHHVNYPDGSVVTLILRHSSRDSGVPSYQDLSGRPLPLPDDLAWTKTARCSGSLRPSREEEHGYSEIEALVTDVQTVHRTKGKLNIEERWLFDTTRNIFVLVQKSYVDATSLEPVPPPPTFERVGTFGLNGFVPAGSVAEPFAGVIKVSNVMVTRGGVYEIDFEHRAMKTLFVSPAGEEILAFCSYEIEEGSKHRDGLYVETTKNLFMVNNAGEIERHFSLTHDPRRYGLGIRDFSVQHRWVLHYLALGEGNVPEYWEIYDDEGKLVELHEFPRAMEFTPGPLTALEPAALALRDRIDAKDGPLAAIGNPALGVMMYGAYRGTFSVGESDNEYQVERMRGVLTPVLTWPGMLTFSLTLLLFAVITVFLARRYGLRVGPWAGLALLMGPAVILTLVATNSLPRRVKCPACGKRRAVGEEACGRCHAGWPAPVRTGTEIFSGG